MRRCTGTEHHVVTWKAKHPIMLPPFVIKHKKVCFEIAGGHTEVKEVVIDPCKNMENTAPYVIHSRLGKLSVRKYRDFNSIWWTRVLSGWACSCLPCSSLRSTPLLLSTCRDTSTLWTFCRRLMAGRRSLADKLQSWMRSSITRLKANPHIKDVTLVKCCMLLAVAPFQLSILLVLQKKWSPKWPESTSLVSVFLF